VCENSTFEIHASGNYIIYCITFYFLILMLLIINLFPKLQARKRYMGAHGSCRYNGNVKTIWHGGTKDNDEQRKCVSPIPKVLSQGKILPSNTYIILLVRAVKKPNMQPKLTWYPQTWIQRRETGKEAATNLRAQNSTQNGAYAKKEWSKVTSVI
jgi:hypothetical protein